MDHLQSLNLLSDAQHGFRRKRSCESQLILVINELAESLNNGDQMDVILLDFQKAFDKVPYQKLLVKLQQYGIRGQLHRWINSFLSNRSQTVVLEGAKSEEVKVTSGVTQGSVLGPILFTIFINDLPKVVDSQVRLFADDCIIYRPVTKSGDAEYLQADINNLMSWAEEWSMLFNPEKCEVIRVTNKKKPLKYMYKISDQMLKSVEDKKYLGVTLPKKTKLEQAGTNCNNESKQHLKPNTQKHGRMSTASKGTLLQISCKANLRVRKHGLGPSHTSKYLQARNGAKKSC